MTIYDQTVIIHKKEIIEAYVNIEETPKKIFEKCSGRSAC
jgi:hypothetical protein